jgi:hypothetical protein
MSYATEFAQAGSTGKTWTPRVTKAQEEAILAAAPTGFEATGTIEAYVLSGDVSELRAEEAAQIKAIRKAAQERMPNESAARRIWPRKVAAVLLANS